MFDDNAFKVVPFDACLGADIQGVDIAEKVAPEIVDLIEAALTEHLVLRFRGHQISDPELLAFSRNFGELDLPAPNPFGQPYHQEHAEINVVSNVIENGVPQGNLGDGEIVWHADMTFNEMPPKASLLYGREIPDSDNHTYFANMYAAYDSLPDDLKRKIDGRTAIHDASHNSAGIARAGYEDAADVRDFHRGDIRSGLQIIDRIECVGDRSGRPGDHWIVVCGIFMLVDRVARIIATDNLH